MNFIQKVIHKILWKIPRLYSDKSFTEAHFEYTFGFPLNLNNPRTFNEKINYKKLFDQNPLLTMTADKITARDYVENKIGNGYFTKIYRVFRTDKDISFDNLPSQFMIKASHGSEWIKIVRDIDQEKINRLRRICRKWLRTNYYYKGRERCYKNVQPGIIIEEILLDNGDIPADYKFFCFHGKVRLAQVDFSRYKDHKRNHYDEKGNLLDVECTYDIDKTKLDLPENSEKMIELAEKLSKEFDFIRVDLFSINNKIYFGELTNYPCNGFKKFEPAEFDMTLGNYWKVQKY